jgi:Flp pilus assembly protein TadD, contains TPR repeats
VLQEQAKLAPQDVRIQAALGLTFRQAKRYAEARQAFQKAAQLAPDNLAMVDQLVELDLLDKRFDAALQTVRRQFQKLLMRRPLYFFEGKILDCAR